MNNKIKIYTDGACSGNPGPGAYAAILIYKDKEKAISGFKGQTTNQEMELLAALSALKAIKNPDIEINLYSDSKYVLDGMSSWMHNWAKKDWTKDICHKALWQDIYKIYTGLKINCIWVKGHSNIFYNEKCDKIARDLIAANTKPCASSFSDKCFENYTATQDTPAVIDKDKLIPKISYREAKALHSSAKWRPFASKINKNPFIKQYLFNKDNICPWCGKAIKYIDSSVVHHIDYNHECDFNAELKIPAPTEKRPERVIRVPDCERCSRERIGLFDQCISRICLIHKTCNFEIIKEKK